MVPVRALTLPRSLRGLPRETFVLALVAFCVALGFGIVVPAVPQGNGRSPSASTTTSSSWNASRASSFTCERAMSS